MNRSKSWIPALVILALVSVPAFGAPEKKLDVDLSPSNWALGIFLGEPTGITVQLDVGETQALEVKAAPSEPAPEAQVKEPTRQAF